MGDKALIYKQKVQDNLKESKQHLKRLNDAFGQLQQKYQIPLDAQNYQDIMTNLQDLAFSDQIIYRFSKLQDCIGAKLFKSILLHQGENIDKPFLDILNQIEKMDIISVDEWFEIRDLRNEIAHDYGANDDVAINMINVIHKVKNELQKSLVLVEKLVNKEAMYLKGESI